MSSKDSNLSLRSLPGVDQVLAWPETDKLCQGISKVLFTGLVREVVDRLREQISRGIQFETGPDGKLLPEIVLSRVETALSDLRNPSLKRVVNATGIILHTNLGRAPLSRAAGAAIERILESYSNLEFDLQTGERGSRHAHLERILRMISGAPAGVVVNNNAAAVLLVLNTLAAGKEVIVSRGELVEIGGSFRIPEIIERGFAKLREIGTTNKTKLADYEDAIGPETALILKVHTSNYKVIGFTQSVPLAELAQLGSKHGIPVMDDLGSGLFMDLSGTTLAGEPTVGDSIRAGADVVTFSGDKLLGGPQAGIIVGKQEIIERVKKNPLMRALRMDKITIATLEEILRGYLDPDNLDSVNSVAALIRRSEGKLEELARELKQRLEQSLPQAELELHQDVSYVGGGSLPQEAIPTRIITIQLPGMTARELSLAFRKSHIPVVGRIKESVFCLDMRSIFEHDLDDISSAAAALSQGL